MQEVDDWREKSAFIRGTTGAFRYAVVGPRFAQQCSGPCNTNEVNLVSSCIRNNTCLVPGLTHVIVGDTDDF